MATARNTSLNGIYAKIVPMRFPDGSYVKIHHGKKYLLPQISTKDGDVLYLIYIYFPRFFFTTIRASITHFNT